MKMNILWLLSILGISVFHFQFSQCNDVNLLGVGIASSKSDAHDGIFNSNLGVNGNNLAGININNSSLLETIFNGGGRFNQVISSDDSFGESIRGSLINFGMSVSDRGNVKDSDGGLSTAVVPAVRNVHNGTTRSPYRGIKQTKAHSQQYGHALSGLVNLGIILPSNKGSHVDEYARIGGRGIHSRFDSDISTKDTTNNSGSNGDQGTYQWRPGAEIKQFAKIKQEAEVRLKKYASPTC